MEQLLIAENNGAHKEINRGWQPAANKAVDDGRPGAGAGPRWSHAAALRHDLRAPVRHQVPAENVPRLAASQGQREQIMSDNFQDHPKTIQCCSSVKFLFL